MNGTCSNSITVGLLALSLLVAAGCQSGAKTDDSAMPMTKKIQVAEPVEILGTRDGDQGDLPHAGAWLIKSQQDLVASNSATIGGLGVDLSTHDIVIVGLGEQPTGGYSVEITAIQQVGDKLYAQIKTTTPAPDAAVTEAMTHPWAAAVIANTSATSVHPDSE